MSSLKSWLGAVFSISSAHKVGLDMDSEKPWVTLHCSLASNLEHLTFCYICLVYRISEGWPLHLVMMILKVFFQPK